MRKLFVLASALVLTLGVKAQDPHFSQFFSSPLTLNPAFTGKFNGTWRLAANHRDQWPSIPKAYVTSSDEGGNFYKSISMMSLDGTKGFSMPVDNYNLFNEFEGKT